MNALVTKPAVALTVAAALIGLSPLAHTAPLDRTITVSFRDLNLSNPEGLEVLYKRIQYAARSVCDFGYAVQELPRVMIAKKCYRTAVDDAVRQINRPTLSALHRAKSKSRLG